MIVRSELPATVIPAQPHVRVGRVNVEQKVDGNLTDMATIKQLYSDAVSAAGSVFDAGQRLRACLAAAETCAISA